MKFIALMIQIFKEMLERNPQARTVPQIFIDDKLVAILT